jgi:hypothetical protein
MYVFRNFADRQDAGRRLSKAAQSRGIILDKTVDGLIK